MNDIQTRVLAEAELRFYTVTEQHLFISDACPVIRSLDTHTLLAVNRELRTFIRKGSLAFGPHLEFKPSALLKSSGLLLQKDLATK